MESRTALITAVTTRIMFTLAAGFLVKNWGESIILVSLESWRKGLPQKVEEKKRENFETVCQNVKLLSVWTGGRTSLASDIFDQHQPKEIQTILESLDSGLEEGLGPTENDLED